MIDRKEVNYWAERYLLDEPKSKDYLPFTSVDLSCQGNREDVRHIAEQLEHESLFPDR